MINWNPVPKLNDKAIQLHMLSGAVTTFGMRMFSKEWVYVLIAVSVVTGVKELWAYLNPSKYSVSFSHAIATILGGTLASIVSKYFL